MIEQAHYCKNPPWPTLILWPGDASAECQTHLLRPRPFQALAAHSRYLFIDKTKTYQQWIEVNNHTRCPIRIVQSIRCKVLVSTSISLALCAAKAPSPLFPSTEVEAPANSSALRERASRSSAVRRMISCVWATPTVRGKNGKSKSGHRLPHITPTAL